MYELTEDNVAAYLHARGRLRPEISAKVRLLAWGVSNVVFRVSPADGDDIVIKQSRARLRTQAEWFSRLDRVWREADFMRAVGPLLPHGVVPRVLFEDRENFLFALEAVEADHVVWKGSLLNGDANPAIAATLGDFLSAIHRETADDASLRQQFGNTEVFDELRVDPFYRRIAQVHPEISPAVQQLIDEMSATNVCLVHADFSPKNILVTTRGLSLVDFETGHYGDPAFDLGFFLSHLLLKTVLHACRSDEYLYLVRAFWNRYVMGLPNVPSGHPLSPEELERRTVAHLASCMLARVDGKSTIDYLPDRSQQDLVRRYTVELLRNSPGDVASAFTRLDHELH